MLQAYATVAGQGEGEQVAVATRGVNDEVATDPVGPEMLTPVSAGTVTRLTVTGALWTVMLPSVALTNRVSAPGAPPAVELTHRPVEGASVPNWFVVVH